MVCYTNNDAVVPYISNLIPLKVKYQDKYLSIQFVSTLAVFSSSHLVNIPKSHG